MWSSKRKTQVGTTNDATATTNPEDKNDQQLQTAHAATEPEKAAATDKPPANSSKVNNPYVVPVQEETTWETTCTNFLFNPCYYCHCWTLRRGCIYIGLLLAVLGAILILVLLYLPKVAANSDNVNEGWLVAADELLKSEDYKISVTVPVSLGSILPGLMLILAAVLKRRAFLVVYTTYACIGAGIVAIGIIDSHSYVATRKPDVGYPDALLPKFKRSKSAISTALWTTGLIDISLLLYSALCSYALYTEVGEENKRNEAAEIMDVQAVPRESTVPRQSTHPRRSTVVQRGNASDQDV